VTGWVPFSVRGRCPVDRDAIVRVKFRDWPSGAEITSTHTYKAGSLRWDRFPDQTAALPYDILAYEVVE